MVVAFLTAVLMRVTAVMMDVPAQVKMRPCIVTIRFSTAVFMMRVRKTQALVGQYQKGKQKCEERANHGKA
ncbi:MAG: hypothetical protein MI757_04045 [Pirellulales bacterium]|nr:hypothetical protein [Pirellulales bacterium]